LANVNPHTQRTRGNKDTPSTSLYLDSQLRDERTGEMKKREEKEKKKKRSKY